MLESPGHPTLVSRVPYETRHLAALDGLRGIAIALVMWYHIWLITWIPANLTLFGQTFNFNVFPETGMTGVTVFFFISGFCLFYPYAQSVFDGRPLHTTRMFAYRRILKIVPSYYAGIALWICLGFATFPTVDETLRQILVHVFFLQTFWDSTYGGINGVLWSLAVEMQFYVLFPAISWAACRKPWLVFGALFAVGNIFRILVVHFSGGPHWIAQLPGSIDTFGAGMLSAWVFRAVAVRAPHLATRKMLWTAVGLAGFAAWYLTLAYMYGRRTEASWITSWNVYGVPMIELVLVPVTIGSLFAFRWWQTALANPVLLGLSYISYNLYLWHQLLSTSIAGANITSFRPSDSAADVQLRLLYTFLLAAASIAVAWIVTTFLEQPLLRSRPLQSFFERKDVRRGGDASGDFRELAPR